VAFLDRLGRTGDGSFDLSVHVGSPERPFQSNALGRDFVQYSRHGPPARTV
jgi:hypothetical protein